MKNSQRITPQPEAREQDTVFLWNILWNIPPVPDLAPLNVLVYESGIVWGHKIFSSFFLRIKIKLFSNFMPTGVSDGSRISLLQPSVF